MEPHTDALKLLRTANTFDFASEELLVAISKLMTLEHATKDYIFVREGDEIEKFMILEEGMLARYKHGRGHLPEDHKESFEHSILIDTIEGRGRVTGLMHNFQPGLKAFATVVVQNDSAKVWIVEGKAFREMLSSTGHFGVELLMAMAKKNRMESKISRALLKSSKSLTSDDTTESNKLRVLCYDTTTWVRNGFLAALEEFNKAMTHDLEIKIDFTEERLSAQSAAYATGYAAICTFVNDTADGETVQTLSMLGVKMIAQRAAGFDRIDTRAARTFGMTVARVPAYSPYAVAEMAVSLLMTVNRKITRASTRVKLANFSLDEGLMGVDIHGKTVGIMGTGKIGAILCNIMLGFGANLLCYDVFESDTVKDAGGVYVTKEELFAKSDVVFLMMPLLPATKHIINLENLHKLKKGVILINTSRGGLVDTMALLEGLKTGHISGVGMDVYENEQDYFFQDWSARTIPDSNLVALLGNHNVVLTAHQAFFTKEAVDKIVSTTLENLRDFALGKTGLDHPNNCIPPPKTK